MLYDDFKPIVDLVFNNWTALQLAVEHGMGAPGGERTAQLMSVYVARHCVENVTDCDDLTEVLEDLMDEEFETVCHDNSPKEVASLLIFYLGLLKEGRHEELHDHIAAMPKSQQWLSQPIYGSVPPQSHGNPDDDTTSSSEEEEEEEEEEDDDESDAEQLDNAAYNQANGAAAAAAARRDEPEPMDEGSDPGWTVVTTRRRK